MNTDGNENDPIPMGKKFHFSVTPRLLPGLDFCIVALFHLHHNWHKKNLKGDCGDIFVWFWKCCECSFHFFSKVDVQFLWNCFSVAQLSTVCIYTLLYCCACLGMGWKWEWPNDNPMGMRIRQTWECEWEGMGIDCMGMGWNGNVKIHSWSSPVC